jgi:hypothetical protein
MNRGLVIAVCLLVASAACGDDGFSADTDATATTAPSQPGYAAEWQRIADDVHALQSDLQRPEHLADPEPALDGSEFDAERYFDVLTHIDVEPGFVLDYVYRAAADRGFPVLYTRRADAARYPTYAEFRTGEGRDAGQDDGGFMEQVYVVDGTPQGFFEYVVLEMVGNHFYLWWHAQEEDDRIVATNERLGEVLDLVAGEMDADDMDRARSVDPTPRVTLDADRATVEVVSFTRWGGLYRTTFTIDRIFPQQILDVTVESLAACDCGLTF